MVIKAFNIVWWRVKKIAVCSMADFYVKPAEELVFCEKTECKMYILYLEVEGFWKGLRMSWNGG